jgi:hypothetical protein
MEFGNLATADLPYRVPADCQLKLSIPPLRHQLHGRAAIFSCNPESGHKKKACDQKILPGVERPLAMPSKLDGIRKWLEVRDGPLVAVGATSADEVAQQVQVEADEDQKCRESGVRRRAAG